jgi:RNA polymerase subunit RPABC4/transcription elongation factor Spt4
MFCKKCGTPLKEGAKFCPACGQTVPAATAKPARGEAKPENLVSGEDEKIAEAIQESLDAENNCLNCGKPLEENWQMCPYCGKEIVRDIVCSNCGKKLEKDWIVCPFCKIPVQNETVQ